MTETTETASTDSDRRLCALQDDGTPAEPIHRAVVAAGHTPLRRAPSLDAPLDSELLYGERIDVFDERDGWAWVQNATDGYVGYAEASALGDAGTDPTHRVSALRTFLYPEPDLKTPPLDLLSLTSMVTIEDQQNGFGDTGHGWIWGGHVSPADRFETNVTAVACAFLGTPYLWGGRTSIGLDCSAFVQLALASCGIAVPRDTDMQEVAVAPVEDWPGGADDLLPGDLIFWPGHVAIWLGQGRLIHANATHMAVTPGGLQEVAEHIEQATGDTVSGIRRPDYPVSA